MAPLEKSEPEKKLHEDILQFIKEITAICGTENIENASLDLNDDEYEIYKKECENITHTIVEIVRLQEQPFDFTPLYRELPDEEFWADIKEEVERLVKDFLTVIPYRKLDEQTRLKLIEKSFDIVYLQREDRKFLSETLGEPSLADAVYEVLMESEFMIVSNYVSRRRFENFLSRRLNLDDKDLDLIWNLYKENFSTILTIVSLKNEFQLIGRIRYLTKRVEELEDLLLLSIPED